MASCALWSLEEATIFMAEGNKNTFEIRLTYYADADDAKEGRESEYQYKIHFDDVDGYVIKSEGVPEKEIVFPENK